MVNRLKKRYRRGHVEENLREGYMVNMGDNVSFNKIIQGNNRNSVYPLYMKHIKFFVYEFLKTYMYALYTGALTDKRLQIQNFNALASSANPMIVAPDIVNTDENGLSIVENQCVYINLKFDDTAYQVSVMLRADQQGPFNVMNYFVSALGIEHNSCQPVNLIEYLIEASIRNSYYRNKILSFSADDDDRADINLINPEDFNCENFDNIYLPEPIKNELSRFQLCVERYEEIGAGLRYLLSGEPGTGKTKSVRTIINNCFGKATIILVEGKAEFKTIFEFADLFKPVIVCIDDLDLFVGSRDNMFSPDSLGSLLQELDGFRKNDIFLLATTNDKGLIDKAASRPGRFDLVLDFNKINKDNYLDLIKVNCYSDAVLSIMDESLIKTLEQHKISGAYLVNLIKQLEIKYRLDPNCDLKNYVDEFIKLSYKGFYNKGDKDSFGFIS